MSSCSRATDTERREQLWPLFNSTPRRVCCAVSPLPAATCTRWHFIAPCTPTDSRSNSCYTHTHKCSRACLLPGAALLTEWYPHCAQHNTPCTCGYAAAHNQRSRDAHALRAHTGGCGSRPFLDNTMHVAAAQLASRRSHMHALLRAPASLHAGRHKLQRLCAGGSRQRAATAASRHNACGGAAVATHELCLFVRVYQRTPTSC